MSKALGLLSGGLDSSLAALTLKRQGVDVTCIAFVTPFFGAGRARQAAEQMDIPLIVSDISDIHLEMIKNPRYGYGKNMNPCIDCHAMMFRLAGEIMAEQGFDFLFSGEVLGQRPMSQNPVALKTVAKFSGHPDRILRPLSAKVLAITPMEEEGLVDREHLLDIQGRSRKRQEALAKEWELTDYPSSGGGCLLTEKSFSNRLRDLLEHNPQATPVDAELLKVGRQFRLADKVKLILGRKRSDNEAMKELIRPEDTTLRAKNFSGPLGLVTGDATPEQFETAAAMVATYGKGSDEENVEILLQRGDQRWEISVAPADRDETRSLLIE
ncbi:MAG: thiamine biosynthesis protein [Desulfuromonas sp.]|mgnify:CR=1 FL=1|nr:MAG: thiamine biosynthesis protein [Desulfuromonas sp.]